MKTERTPVGGSDHSGHTGATQTVDAEIHRLIAADKCKQAVELAKNQHKRANTPESRRSLVQAYVARIEQFQNKRMAQEAQTLLNLVQERFPAERHQLVALEVRAAAAGGRLDDLLRPLASEQTSPELRALIETTVRRHIVDMPAISACAALPAEHPLRVGAAAVWRAFDAVTKGQVVEADIALPEVSHRSPLAGWKLAIRAIAAFYRRDDAGCRRTIDAIPSDSAIARVGAALRSALDGERPQVGIAAVLYDRVLSDDRPLRAALEKIESASDGYNLTTLRSGIREAVRSCSASRPNLLDRLQQHIFVWCMSRDVPLDEVRPLPRSTKKDAYFWRLLAGIDVSNNPPSLTALFWERFLRHGVHEGMFTESSMEAATVWLKIAAVLSQFSLREIAADLEEIGGNSVISSMYGHQPADIAALCPVSEQKLAEDVLEPGRAFLRAATMRRDLQTFQLWWAWAQRVDLPVKQQEDIALQWHRIRPRDVEPLVILATLAESRDALSMAIKWVGAAEAIDPLNQQVRQARTRLTLSIAWRHFADRKAHLVEKDLADLAALPSMVEGGRAGVLESMRGAWHLLRGDHAAHQASVESVTRQLGPLVGPVVFNSIRLIAKVAHSSSVTFATDPSEGSPAEVARAMARTSRLCLDLNLTLHRPAAWSPLVAQALRQQPCALSNADLITIATAAVTVSEVDLAYLASAAGLARADSPAVTARFLLLRAQSLNLPWQARRTKQCLRTALQLARQAHDEDLIREIFALLDRDPFANRLIGRENNGKELPDEVLQRALESERKATEYPRGYSENDSVVVQGIDPQRIAPFFQFDDDSAEYEEEDDDFDDTDEGEGFPNMFDMDPRESMDADHLSPEEINELNRLLKAEGISSPDDLMADPTPLIAAAAKMIGKKMSPAEIRAIAEELKEAAGGVSAADFFSGVGGRSKKPNKRRR